MLADDLRDALAPDAGAAANAHSLQLISSKAEVLFRAAARLRGRLPASQESKSSPPYEKSALVISQIQSKIIKVAQPVLPRYSVKLFGCQPLLFLQQPVSKRASQNSH